MSAGITTTKRISTQGWILRMESLAILALALVLYAVNGFSWLIFIALLLVPDLSMLGYAFGQRSGATIYNLVHTYTTPLFLGAIALALGWTLGLQFALIWLAHIALDRLVGYGLKYEDDFKHTHLNQI